MLQQRKRALTLRFGGVLWYSGRVRIREVSTVFTSSYTPLLRDLRRRQRIEPEKPEEGVFYVMSSVTMNRNENTGIITPLERCPALILNADYRPLSYFPLSIWPWQEAVKAIFRDTVTVLSEYEQVVRSPSFELQLPSVLALKEYVPTARKPAFTRFNVFLRDQWKCQYCVDDFKTHQLTFDHVIPRSKGGRTSWENIVAACKPCNTKKGHKLPHEAGMFPAREPGPPSIKQLQAHGRKFPPNFLHESWEDFLYWDTELVDA